MAAMKCIICKNDMVPYFDKRYNKFDLSTVEYSRCVECGFVISKTHVDMTQSEWETLNNCYHSSFHGTDECEDDPRWVTRLNSQATVIADLNSLGLLPNKQPWLDYGCGDAKLSKLLLNDFGLILYKYDRYLGDHSYLKLSDLKSRSFSFVITTSVFEHIFKRKDLNKISSLVNDNGVFGIHTYVDENITNDPDWFYLLPVHCSFYSNKSMKILFDEWGYKASIYHVDSRLWFWFKTDIDAIESKIQIANKRPGREFLYYHFKRGFMDYWK